MLDNSAGMWVFSIAIPKISNINGEIDTHNDCPILLKTSANPMHRNAIKIAFLIDLNEIRVKLPCIKKAAIPIKKNRKLFSFVLKLNFNSVKIEKLVSKPEKIIIPSSDKIKRRSGENDS